MTSTSLPWADSMKRPMLGVALAAALLIWPFGSKKQFRLAPTAAAPGATAVATVDGDSNGNTIVKLEVKYLAPATMLHPAQVVYVVWTEGIGRPAENQAVLKVNNDREASVTFPVPYSNFRLFITAEATPTVTAPGEQTVLAGQISP